MSPVTKEGERDSGQAKITVVHESSLVHESYNLYACLQGADWPLGTILQASVYTLTP